MIRLIRRIRERVARAFGVRGHLAAVENAIQSLGDGVVLYDPDDRVVWVNRRFREIHALTPLTYRIGAHYSDILRAAVASGEVPAPAEGVEAWVARRVAERRRSESYTLLLKGGCWLRITDRCTQDGSLVSIHSDVTELKLAEAATEGARASLERQTEMLSTLIENLDVGVSLVDAHGRLVALNSAYLDLFGIPRGTFGVGDTYEACIRYMVEHGDHDVPANEDVETTVRRVVANAMRPVPQKFERKRRNGRTIEIRRAPLPGGGFVTTYIDETDARQREADLTRIRGELEAKAVELAATARSLHAANAAKSMFLANMSHELRTPLNAILGFSEIMRDAMLGPLDQRYRGYAKDIHLSGAYLLRLINDILDTSKIDAGQMHLEQDRIDLAELIGECERLVLERARTAGVAVVCAIGRGFPPIAGDRLRLKQALLNLLVNAVKFTPAGGSVRVSASAARPHGIDIAIADTGIGMEPASIARALEPFQQLDNRLARRYEGTGLGLPLAKSLIELHGGRLTIESAASKGTTARIWLPPERLLDQTSVARSARRATRA